MLDWQQKSNLNVTPTQLHRRNTKSKFNLLLLEKGRYPCSRARGWTQQKQKPFSRSQKVDDCCQICWSPVSREHPEREENYDDMPQCDTCQRTYHCNCLTDLNACSHTARQDAENSEDWHCPACTDLTQAEKDTRNPMQKKKKWYKWSGNPHGKRQNCS